VNNIRYYTTGKRDQNKVTLTFDDGPTPGVTEQVIDVLNSYGVRGTFFVVGKWVQSAGGADTVRRLIENGHTVGNHTNQHLHPPTVTTYPITEFADAEQIISKVLGAPTRYARAPYLIYQPHVCGALSSWVGTRKIVDGEVWGYDWENWQVPDADKNITNIVLNSEKLGPGAIIILHDGSELPEERFIRPIPMIKALPVIIEGVRAKGLEFASLDDFAFDEADLIDLACELPPIA
jgi:peptidoglycan/xylan/chitin deacetylase (PgdA/CDA1 family)